jgi:hypothetical protein
VIPKSSEPELGDGSGVVLASCGRKRGIIWVFLLLFLFACLDLFRSRLRVSCDDRTPTLVQRLLELRVLDNLRED